MRAYKKVNFEMPKNFMGMAHKTILWPSSVKSETGLLLLANKRNWEREREGERKRKKIDQQDRQETMKEQKHIKQNQ